MGETSGWPWFLDLILVVGGSPKWKPRGEGASDALGVLMEYLG